jgi:hypothetical protein
MNRLMPSRTAAPISSIFWAHTRQCFSSTGKSLPVC